MKQDRDDPLETGGCRSYLSVIGVERALQMLAFYSAVRSHERAKVAVNFEVMHVANRMVAWGSVDG